MEKMNSTSYLALNHWLQTADMNYTSGRMLWINHLIDGACNLLWLSSEQIIKILLLQTDIEKLSSGCNNLDEMYKILDIAGKDLGHKVNDLSKNLKSTYPSLDVSNYTPTLLKLNEYFYRRYAVREGTSISLKLITDVDRMYFDLRSQVHPEVGMSLMEEITIRVKRNWRHPVDSFGYAHHNNPFFAPRRIKKHTLIGPDGKTHHEDWSWPQG